MQKELTHWNNLRMILGIIPFEGITNKPFWFLGTRPTMERLSYQYHNYEIPSEEELKDNEKKAGLL